MSGGQGLAAKRRGGEVGPGRGLGTGGPPPLLRSFPHSCGDPSPGPDIQLTLGWGAGASYTVTPSQGAELQLALGWCGGGWLHGDPSPGTELQLAGGESLHWAL